MPKTRKTKNDKYTVSVDFSNTSSRLVLPEGTYSFRVKKATFETPDGDKTPYINWELKTISDNKKFNNKTVYNKTYMSENSLWVLRNLLEALGVDIPDSPTELNLKDYVELEFTASVNVEEYQDNEGRKKEQNKFDPSSYRMYDGEKASDTENDEVEEDEIEEVEEDEIEEVQEDEIEEVEEGEEDEIEEAPKKKSSKKKLQKISFEEVHDASEEELESINEEYDLEVDLSSYKTLPRKAKAIVTALEEMDLLDD